MPVHSINTLRKNCTIISRQDKEKGLLKVVEDLRNEISIKEKILEDKKIKSLEDLNDLHSKSDSEKDNGLTKEEKLYALESQRNQMQIKVIKLPD